MRQVTLRKGIRNEFGLHIRPLDFASHTGAVVVSLERETPAARSCAILAGDEIVKLGGHACRRMPFTRIVSKISIRGEIVLELEQHANVHTLLLPVPDTCAAGSGNAYHDGADAADRAHVLGITVEPPRDDVGAWWTRVVRIERGSLAERAGFQAGDLICDCDELSATGTTHADILTAIKTRAGGTVCVSVQRKHRPRPDVPDSLGGGVGIGGSCIDEDPGTTLRAGGASTDGSAQAPRARRLQPQPVFEEIATMLTPEIASQINAVFMLNMTPAEGGTEPTKWTLDFVRSRIYQGLPESAPDVVLTMTEATVGRWLNREQSAATAFMLGRLRVDGDRTLALRLNLLEPLLAQVCMCVHV